jgi:hypothetical protein
MAPSSVRRTALIIFLSLLLITAFAVTLFLFLKKPVLTSISPRSARAGEIVVVDGRFLGTRSPRNELLVGDQRITSSYVVEWESDRISFRLPEGVRSGDLKVILPQGESNPLLLTNSDTIPVLVGPSRDRGYEVSLREDSDSSYWEFLFRGYTSGELKESRWYFDGGRIPESRIFREDESIGVYIPLTELIGFPLVDRDEEFLTAELTRRLEIRFAETGDPDELSYVGSGKNRRTAMYDTGIPAETDPLFIWEITIPRQEDEAVPQAMEIRLPELRLTEGSMAVETSLSGIVARLPDAPITRPDQLVLRYIPRRRIYGDQYGKIYLRYFGRLTPPSDLSSELADAGDNYDNAGAFLSLYQDFLSPEGDTVLSDEARNDLRRDLAGVRGALPIARAMYLWLINQEMTGRMRTDAYIDELRRLGIGARLRRGFLQDDEGVFKLSTWAEFFIPRWGWLPVYQESMEAGLPFGRSNYSYLPLPLESPFPGIFADDGSPLPMNVRLIQPSAAE